RFCFFNSVSTTLNSPWDISPVNLEKTDVLHLRRDVRWRPELERLDLAIGGIEASEGNRHSLCKATAKNVHYGLHCCISILGADAVNSHHDLRYWRHCQCAG